MAATGTLFSSAVKRAWFGLALLEDMVPPTEVPVSVDVEGVVVEVALPLLVSVVVEVALPLLGLVVV